MFRKAISWTVAAFLFCILVLSQNGRLSYTYDIYAQGPAHAEPSVADLDWGVLYVDKGPLLVPPYLWSLKSGHIPSWASTGGDKQEVVVYSPQTPTIYLARYVNTTTYLSIDPAWNAKSIDIEVGSNYSGQYYKLGNGTFTYSSDGVYRMTIDSTLGEYPGEVGVAPEGSVFRLWVVVTFYQQPWGTFNLYYGPNQPSRIELTGVALLPPKTITVPDDYPTIQQAINNANEGDIVFVKNGTYYENVVVNKTVVLSGENGEATVIDGRGAENVVNILHSDVAFSGFTVQNGTNGIYVSEFYSRINLSQNLIRETYNAVSLRQSSGNYLSNNVIERNENGIEFWYCGNSTVSGNRITQNRYGIELAYSRFFTFRNNVLLDNIYNFGIWSYGMPPYGSFFDFLHDIDTSNTINGKPVYYWIDRHDDRIPYDAGYVGIVSSTNITITNLNLTNNGQGALIAFSTNSTVYGLNVSKTMNGIRLVCSNSTEVENNFVANNNHGIFDTLSANDTIVGNQLLNNERTGIAIANSNGTKITDNLIQGNGYGISVDGNPPFGGGKYNVIYHNSFINNTYQVDPYTSVPSDNIWDNGFDGNYWSDYTGTDSDYNGIGDVPYVINESNIDSYPLMSPYVYADVNHDAVVNMRDIGLICDAFDVYPGHPNWNPHYDINEDNVVNMRDIGIACNNFGATGP